MSFFDALILSIVQGLTEFFPISSSAHIKLVSILFNIKEENSFFDLSCHLGTVLAALFFFRKEILSMLLKERHKIVYILLAILPLFPVYFLLHSVIKFFSKEVFLGFFLILTSIILFVMVYLKPISNQFSHKIKDVLLIGSAQAIALIPGLSRSGSTIATAYFRGWPMQEAICFSFILSIPCILGGSFLETIKSISLHEPIPISNCFIGFCGSFLIGMVMVNFVFKIMNKSVLKAFAWYCLNLGILSSIYLNK